MDYRPQDQPNRPWETGAPINDRQYALVSLERNPATGGPDNVAVLRLLDGDEAQAIFHGSHCESDHSEDNRVAAAIHFIKHCNQQTEVCQVTKRSYPRYSDDGASNEVEYETVTPELPVQQEKAFSLACALVAQFFADGLADDRMDFVRELISGGNSGEKA